MRLLPTSFIFYLALFSIVLTWSACPGDDDLMPPPPEIEVYDEEGFFVINSGGEVANGSVSFYHRDYGLVKNKIYQEANNGATLGTNVRSMTLIDNKAYIVGTGSNKIIIADPKTMLKLGEINGFNQPRYIIEVGPGKAYVSQWGYAGQYGSIQIVDLNSNIIVDSIPTRLGPEELLKVGNAAYVTNTGGLFIDSVVTKINVFSDEVLRIITVGKTPTYLEADKNLNLWVLSRGVILDPNTPENNISGQLVKIEEDQVVNSIPVRPSAGPLSINRTRDKLYFVQNGWVYEHPIENSALPLVPFIERFYSVFEVDPLNGYFIGTNPQDYIEAGELYLFKSDKMPLDTASIGKGPIGVTFYR